MEMQGAKIITEELHNFVTNLQRFNKECEEETDIVYGKAKMLGETWRDPSYDKFIEEFDRAVQGMRDFVEASNQHIPYLQRKIQEAEEAATY